MFALHQYVVPASVKLLFVLLVFTSEFTFVSVSYVFHVPVLLLLQCIVSVESGSVGIICVVGVEHIPVFVLYGAAPLCVGSLFNVKLYVWFVQFPHVSVMFALHQYVVPASVKFVLVHSWL